MTYKSQRQVTVSPAIGFLEAWKEKEDLNILVELKWRDIKSLFLLEYGLNLAPSVC